MPSSAEQTPDDVISLELKCQANMWILKDHSHIPNSSGTSRFVLLFHARDAYMLTEDVTQVVLNLELTSALHTLQGLGGAQTRVPTSRVSLR